VLSKQAKEAKEKGSKAKLTVAEAEEEEAGRSSSCLTA